MSIYRHFARVYSQGPYTSFSTRIAELYPMLLESYDLPDSGRLLDMACGEGTFAVLMMEQGWKATGVDQSAEMIKLACSKAVEKNVDAEFQVQDIRTLPFYQEFDLVTCLFDSLNYLINPSDIAQAFNGAFRALRPGGWFLFDMNTIYGLSVLWQEERCSIQQDTSDLLEIHSPSYDYEDQIASVQITIFLRAGDLWERFDEVHTERAYPIEQLRGMLQTAGFNVVDILNSLKEQLPPQPDSGRVWFICQKKPIRESH